MLPPLTTKNVYEKINYLCHNKLYFVVLVFFIAYCHVTPRTYTKNALYNSGVDNL